MLDRSALDNQSLQWYIRRISLLPFSRHTSMSEKYSRSQVEIVEHISFSLASRYKHRLVVSFPLNHPLSLRMKHSMCNLLVVWLTVWHVLNLVYTYLHTWCYKLANLGSPIYLLVYCKFRKTQRQSGIPTRVNLLYTYRVSYTMLFVSHTLKLYIAPAWCICFDAECVTVRMLVHAMTNVPPRLAEG